MPPEVAKLLVDVGMAAAHSRAKTRGKRQADSRANDVMHPAIERQFGIIGEALRRLTRLAPQAVTQIPHHAQITAFRNILVHGYDAIYERHVCDAIGRGVPLVWFPRLLHTTPEQRGRRELLGDGKRVHRPLADEDLSVEGLLAGRRSRGGTRPDDERSRTV